MLYVKAQCHNFFILLISIINVNVTIILKQSEAKK